ncbi:MAG: ATP-dependent protease subunit HslV [candidate division WOR-3 bacterium]|nr:ATP-dependent protease subunit HslV [candidate division WOR-3 bacterium]
MKKFLATTIIGLRKENKCAMASDGQVTLGDTIVKETAKKIRKVFNDKVLVGFAGSAADAFTLFERFENKLQEFHGNLPRAVVELAKDWRQDRVLRRLEALLAILNPEHAYIVSGSGDVIEPDDGIVAIGSGGAYALAVARALSKYTDLEPKQIVTEAIKIAASINIYTNQEITVETLE